MEGGTCTAGLTLPPAVGRVRNGDRLWVVSSQAMSVPFFTALSPVRLLLVQVLAWSALCSLLACTSSPKTVTRLVLVSDTDMSELDEAEFVVTSPEGEVRDAIGPLRPGEPAFVVMEKSKGASAGPYQVTVRGLDNGSELLTRRASLSFIEGETRTALLHLVRACVDEKCSGEKVCAAGGCRGEALASSELERWTGEPPTLDRGNEPTDAGRDAAVPDASLSDDGGLGEPCRADVPTCVDERLVVCSDGKVTGTMECPPAGTCQKSLCRNAQGCTKVPSDEGAPCGTGLTCQEGVCGAGDTCMGNCSPSCDQQVAGCELHCGNAGNCSPSCRAGSTCDVLCEDASNCAVSCLGTCDVACGEAGNCVVRCAPGSTCDIACERASNCDKIECEGDARCILRCRDSSGSGSGGNCDFETCPNGGPQSCNNNVIVCHTPCP